MSWSLPFTVLSTNITLRNTDVLTMSMFHPDSLSRGGGGQTRVWEMLRRGSNHQAVWQNKVKIQGGGGGGGHLGFKGGCCMYFSLSPQILVEVSKTEL